MMTKRTSTTVRVPLAELIGEQTVEIDGLKHRFFLSPSDIPRSMSVNVEVESGADAKLGIELLYNYDAAQDEDRITAKRGMVSVAVGKHSQRLFECKLQVTLPPSALSTPMGLEQEVGLIAKRIAGDLHAAFTTLRGEALRQGPRLNYTAVESGTLPQKDSNGPPPWLIDALHKLRDQGRDSRP